jgi:organic hydroperoxide reductase OsmC/OhrA
MAMTEVLIKPSIMFKDNVRPDAALLDELFKKAHDNCFISSSVKTSVKIEEAVAA